MSINTLLISSQQIKDRTGLHSNVDEKLVNPDIKYAQDAYILPLLGTALMDRMQDFIEADNLSGVYATLYNVYLIDALAYYTLSESQSTISYQLYNKGVVRKNDENSSQANEIEILNMASRYRKRAEYYGQRLADYLLENHASFPEYTSPGNGVDTIHPDVKAYSPSFVMNDARSCGSGFLPTSTSRYKNGCR